MEKLKTLLPLNKIKFKGITSLELILTIGIIGILSLMIILNSNIITDKIEKSELKSIQRDIIAARNYSICSMSRNEIIFDPVDSSYTMKHCNEKIQLEALKIMKNHEKHNTNKFIFTEKGIPAYDSLNERNSAGTLVLKGKKKIYIISVTPIVGKVNVSTKNE